MASAVLCTMNENFAIVMIICLHPIENDSNYLRDEIRNGNPRKKSRERTKIKKETARYKLKIGHLLHHYVKHFISYFLHTFHLIRALDYSDSCKIFFRIHVGYLWKLQIDLLMHTA